MRWNLAVAALATAWGFISVIGLLGAVSYCYVFLLRRVTAQAIGILSYIEPVSAALLTWAILGQSFGWQVAVGGALVVLAGTMIVVLEPAEAPLEAPGVRGLM